MFKLSQAHSKIGYFKCTLFGIGLMGLSGCGVSAANTYLEETFKPVIRQMGALWSEWFGPNLELAAKPVASPGSNRSTALGKPFVVEDPIVRAGRIARENSELLREMLTVVFMKEPKDRADFGNWVDTLNQGASLEGVFNGLTHSSAYRELEEQSLGASPQVLTLFGEELAALELEVPDPIRLDGVLPFPVGSPQVAGSNDTAVLAKYYSTQKVGASIFTLKRILSDEALRVISTKNPYREKLATWYSKLVMRLDLRHVDFGISLRNRRDERFHYQWALDNSEDRLRWEVLNRYQRILNAYSQRK